mgnify:FL=1
MNVTFKKLLYLIVFPLSILYIHYFMVVDFGLTWIGYILFSIIWIGTLGKMYLIWKSHPTYRFTIGIEYVPVCSIGIGYHSKLIGIILPFIVIPFGWKRKNIGL